MIAPPISRRRAPPRENEFSVDQLLIARIVIDRGQLSTRQRRELRRRRERGQVACSVSREGWTYWYAV